MMRVIVKTDPSPRQRMIESAMALVAEHGVDGTSFSQVIEHSGAPRGSIYHHFPGGKAQLMEEATRYGGDPTDRARSVATMLVAAVEGAVILSRAEGSGEPLEQVVDELHRLMHAALE